MQLTKELLKLKEGENKIRIYQVNTDKIIHSTFQCQRWSGRSRRGLFNCRRFMEQDLKLGWII